MKKLVSLVLSLCLVLSMGRLYKRFCRAHRDRVLDSAVRQLRRSYPKDLR